MCEGYKPTDRRDSYFQGNKRMRHVKNKYQGDNFT